jgi:hypothetical protein
VTRTASDGASSSTNSDWLRLLKRWKPASLQSAVIANGAPKPIPNTTRSDPGRRSELGSAASGR